MKKISEFINSLTVKELIQVGRDVLIEKAPVTDYYNKNKPEYYKQKEKLKGLIKKEAIKKNDKIKNAFVNVLYDRYEIHSSLLRMTYKNGEIIIREDLELTVGGWQEKDARIMEHFKNGMPVKRTVKADFLKKSERWILRQIYPDASDGMYGIRNLQNLKKLNEVLDDYWNNPHEFVYHGYKKKTDIIYSVNLSISGHEDVVFEVCYAPYRDEITTIHVPEMNLCNMHHVLKDEELVHFITEKAPCRMELLFEREKVS